MGLDEIEKQIREEGQKHIDEINKRNEEEIDQIRSGFADDAEKEYKKILEDGKKEADLSKMMIITDARVKAQQRIREEKIELIKNIFDTARKRILSMDDAEKSKILEKLSKDKEKVKDPVLWVDPAYEDLINAKTKSINDFGLIIESKDGSMCIDNTLNSLISRSQDTLRPKIAKILFDG